MRADEARGDLHRYVQTVTFIDIALTQSVIYNIDVIRILILTHAKVCWLDISMYVLSIMYEFKYLEYSDSKSQCCPHSKHLINWYKIE